MPARSPVLLRLRLRFTFFGGRSWRRFFSRPFRLRHRLRRAIICADAGAATDASRTTERLAVDDRWIPREESEAVGALVLGIATVCRRGSCRRWRRRPRRRRRGAARRCGFGVGTCVFILPGVLGVFGLIALISQLAVGSRNGVNGRTTVGAGAGSAIGAAAAAIRLALKCGLRPVEFGETAVANVCWRRLFTTAVCVRDGHRCLCRQESPASSVRLQLIRNYEINLGKIAALT